MADSPSRSQHLSRPWVVCSVMEADAKATLQQVAGAPAGCGIVEVRADLLGEAEITRVVAKSSRPLIVTVRRTVDGGGYDGDEARRVALLSAALDAGATYVDVEWRGAAETLVEGDRANRVILSHHGAACAAASLADLYREMATSPAALLKIVPLAVRPADGLAVRALLARANAREPGRLACFAMGRAGAMTRVFAPRWGSWGTYGAARGDRPTAAGQFTAGDLISIYDVLGIGPSTRGFGLIGSRVFGSPSPAMHAAGYADGGIDARYVPVEVDALDDFLPWLEPGAGGDLEGFAVTMPFKEQVAERARPGDSLSATCGAVNTVTVGEDGWTGFNTDGPAAVRLIVERLEVNDLRGVELAIVGAGGTARAIAAAALQSGAGVTLFNRSTPRGLAAARAVGARFVPLDTLGSANWDVLVNATPLGTAGETFLEPAALCGALVLDAVYGAHTTPLIASAREEGLGTVDGFDLLVEQALLQFRHLTGRTPDREVLRAAGRRWLSRLQ